MKKMLLATALALLITGCARILLFKTNRQRVAQKPSPIISSFLEIGQKKLSMQPKFALAAQEMLLKQKPSKHS